MIPRLAAGFNCGLREMKKGPEGPFGTAVVCDQARIKNAMISA
jgi:hypothetical protein